MKKYFTIGMAGHIDHGKTTLTKALTGIETDRLKEEQERKISIEPGFAPLFQEEDLAVSIIDVPGHERFIRQMIAGVAGIDLFILVIAATEGVMPQTREHLEILSLLGITDGIVVLTKMDEVDEELFEIVLEDVKEQLALFNLSKLPIHKLDSLSGKGVDELKSSIREKLIDKTEKALNPSFRLPIDQVFTVKGQGAIVRGTVYDGEVSVGEEVRVLPSEKKIRIRQIERHHEQMETAKQGQRAALNLGGISYDELKRGDVLVSDDYFSVSNRLDVVLFPLQSIDHPIKQRQTVKLHIGTSEVMGRIIFYDRNEIGPNSKLKEVYCQLELEDPVVIARGDRFIIRRPTPAETIGGGWVIEAEAEKHRFGQSTIDELQRKKEGSPKERIESVLRERTILSLDSLKRLTSLSDDQIEKAGEVLYKVEEDLYTLQSIFTELQGEILSQITKFHEEYPMRVGLNKAEVYSRLSTFSESLIELAIGALEEQGKIKVSNQFVSLFGVSPSLPPQWEKRLTGVEQNLIAQGLEVDWWNRLFEGTNIPEDIKQDYYYYLLEAKKAYIFDEGRLVSARAVEEAVARLKEEIPEESFNLQRVRDLLQLTRKNLIPLLELFDELGYTERIDNERKWLK